MKVHRFYCARMVSLCASGSGVLMVSGTASHSGALGALARSLTRRRDAQWLKGIFRALAITGCGYWETHSASRSECRINRQTG